MTPQPSYPDVPHLLAELQSDNMHRRYAAVEALAAAKLDTLEVVNAFKTVANMDKSHYVREVALNALKALGPAVGDLKPYMVPPVVGKPQTRAVKITAFAIGFVGWNLVNGLIFLVMDLIALLASQIPLDVIMGFLLLSLVCLVLTNPVALIVLAFKQRWAAWGMLSALVLNAIALTLLKPLWQVTSQATSVPDTVLWAIILGYLEPFWLRLAWHAFM